MDTGCQILCAPTKNRRSRSAGLSTSLSQILIALAIGVGVVVARCSRHLSSSAVVITGCATCVAEEAEVAVHISERTMSRAARGCVRAAAVRKRYTAKWQGKSSSHHDR